MLGLSDDVPYRIQDRVSQTAGSRSETTPASAHSNPDRQAFSTVAAISLADAACARKKEEPVKLRGCRLKRVAHIVSAAVKADTLIREHVVEWPAILFCMSFCRDIYSQSITWNRLDVAFVFLTSVSTIACP